MPRTQKRKPGRPARTEQVARLSVFISPALKRKLQIAKLDEGRDMGLIVSDALEQYLKRRRG